MIVKFSLVNPNEKYLNYKDSLPDKCKRTFPIYFSFVLHSATYF